MWKPRFAGVVLFDVVIANSGLEDSGAEVPVYPDKADQYPEDFDQERGEIEINQQRNNDQACPQGVEH